MIATKKEFYDDVDLPVVDDLEKNYASIRAEFTSAVSTADYQEWHQREAYNKGWNVFGLRFFRDDIPLAHKACPAASQLIKRFDKLVVTAGFSILEPGTIIYPHVGYTEDVLRCHLAIIVPEGDCAMRVGRTIHKWEEGRAFVFDDTIDHEVWNRTDSRRIVFLLDFDRKELLG